MKAERRSPRIKHVSWGRLEIEGEAEPYKDAKVFPGGSREWNWRETGTNHVPGIQPDDVRELLDHGARVVVLSRGMKECLEVPRATLDFLEAQQVQAHVLPTRGGQALQPARRRRAGRRTLPHDMLKICSKLFHQLGFSA